MLLFYQSFGNRLYSVKIPELKIGNLKSELPIIQGGMAVRVSRHSLASAVANCGGIGVIAASGMEPDELRNEIRQARQKISGDKGLLGVNIMFAASEFNTLLDVAIEEKIDLVISGAGFGRDAFKICKAGGVNYVPIVSSVKLAILAKKLGGSAIIVESGEAGGHIGTNRDTRSIIPEIIEALKDVETPFGNDYEVPIIAAGGITSGYDIVEMMNLGCSGVQMATRFVLSEECDVSDNFKQVLLNASCDDIVSIQSPVGLPANAVRTSFSDQINNHTAAKPKKCIKCLKHCSKDFCIIESLKKSHKGNLEDGLFFSGTQVGKYNQILPVKTIMNNLVEEMQEAFSGKVLTNK